MDVGTKGIICHAITSSGYFTNVLDGEPRSIMHHVYPLAFIRLYEPSSADENVYVYTSPTKLVDVHFNTESPETIKENVFSCTNYDIHNYALVYLASAEYNLSDMPTDSRVEGRFLFYYRDFTCTVMQLFAVAEKPAKSSSFRGADVERLYLQRRAGNEPGKYTFTFRLV